MQVNLTPNREIVFPIHDNIFFADPSGPSYLGNQILGKRIATPSMINNNVNLRQLPQDESLIEYKSLVNIFKLKQKEIDFLNELFASTPFINMTLVDLIGVYVYEQIQKLKTKMPEKDCESVLDNFFIYFWGSYLHFDRKLYPNVQPSKFTSKFFFEMKTIEDELLKIPVQITKACKKLIGNGDTKANSAKARLQNQLHLQSKEPITRITTALHFFIKIIKHERGQLVLGDCIIHFKEAKTIPSPTVENRNGYLDHLSIYSCFIDSMLKSASKAGICVVQVAAFKDLPNKLLQLKEKNNFTNKLEILHEYLHYTLMEQTNFLQTSYDAYEAACAGRLTYQEWLQQHDIRSKGTKEQKFFIEQMLLQNCCFDFIDYFLTKIKENLTAQVILPCFSGYSDHTLFMDRFITNYQSCPQSIPVHSLSQSESEIINDFENTLCRIIEPIEGLFSELIYDTRFTKFADSENFTKLCYGKCAIVLWLSMLKPLSHVIPLLDHVKSELTSGTELLNAFFEERQNQMRKLSSLEREEICKEIHELCVAKSEFLIKMIMIIDDISSLLEGRFSLEVKTFPDELLNFLVLNKIYELEDPSQESDDDSLEFEAAALPSPSADDLSQSLAAVEVIEEALLEEVVDEKEGDLQSLLAAQAAAVPGFAHKQNIKLQHKATPKGNEKTSLKRPQIALPSKEEFIKTRRTRDLLTLLDKLGFNIERQRGSHQILQHGRRGSLPIPRGSEQRRGTLGNIYDIAKDILESAESKE